MMSWGVMGGQLSGWGIVEEGWRKGPWTAEEDRFLIEYVRVHGEGRWNSVARHTGLKRNGKSCRLRWVNYLRPDLKRGQITPYEERLILELHARWGNRWSTIARSLPGRTDNEIKNYWRTHFKKKTKSSTDENSERTKNRLLRRQQFQKQQQQQQLQLQLQLQQQQEQQQQQQLLQLNQIDMKKIMSLLEDDGYNSSGSSSSNSNDGNDNNAAEAYVPQPALTTATRNPSMTEEYYHQLCNSYCPMVPPMIAPVATTAYDDSFLWDDGLWNSDVEGYGNLGVAASNAGCYAPSKASFQLVAPYC